jgi:hypothetical protein
MVRCCPTDDDGCLGHPFLGRLAVAGRVCAAMCYSTPRRCVGSTPMLFWSGCWAQPGIGEMASFIGEAMPRAPSSQVYLAVCVASW